MAWKSKTASLLVVTAGVVASAVWAGCLGIGTPAGWPPKPDMPPDVGTRHGSGCQVLHIGTFLPRCARVSLEVTEDFARENAASWKEASLEMGAPSPWASHEDFLPRPFVLNSTTQPRLAYYFDHPDSKHASDASEDDLDGLLIPDIRPGRWYPWEVTSRVSSDNPALDGLGLLAGGSTVERGWVLVDANEHDDHVWFSGPDGNVTKNQGYDVALPGPEHVGLDDIFVCP